jgi:DNA-directed RNA polymerase subunit RPC12/RpoP
VPDIKPRIRFWCEQCGADVDAAIDADDGSVECPLCSHTVHADVYLGFGGTDALRRGEEWWS